MAHSKCSLRAGNTIFLSVFFHNLSRYDAHHILKELKLKVSEEVSAIAKTDETFISLSVNMPVGSYTKKSGKTVKLFQSMRFLDSYQFVSQSLDNLAETLKTGDFLILKEFFWNNPDQFFCKLTQKGFFPYSFLDSVAKFEEPLPDFGDSWKNSLTVKFDITLQDYQHALDIYENSVAKTWEITAMPIWKLMGFFWLIFLRSFKVSAWTFTSSIPLTFTLLQIWVGSRRSSRQKRSWDFWKMLICFYFLSEASGVASMELASCGILLRTIPFSAHSIQVRKQHLAHFMM